MKNIKFQVISLFYVQCKSNEHQLILPEANIEELVGDHFTEITFPE